jgi:hypothetical protein
MLPSLRRMEVSKFLCDSSIAAMSDSRKRDRSLLDPDSVDGFDVKNARIQTDSPAPVADSLAADHSKLESAVDDETTEEIDPAAQCRADLVCFMQRIMA